MYPWQADQWDYLLRLKQQNRLPHALLFAGIAGTGKAIFADRFSRLLLCQQPTLSNQPCYHCHACRLIEGRAHPNVLWIEPEKEGHAIKVDQIRDANEFIYQSALQGEYRIIIIHPANSMNTNAANALLKTLEEPSSGAVIILISDSFSRLPATILSRCQRILFPRPHQTQALQWLQSELANPATDPALLLKLAHGAPLAALKLVQENQLAGRQILFDALALLAKRQGDPLKSAANVQNMEPVQLLDYMLSWTMDLLRLQLGVGAENLLNTDYKEQLTALSERTDPQRNVKLMADLQRLRAEIYAGIHLNKTLLVESVLIQWMNAAA